MNIIFFGTPNFAANNLKALINAGHEIAAIVCPADSRKGRGKQLKPCAVKEVGQEKNITVLQPLKLKDEDFIKSLKSFNADLFVVVAFRMLPELVWRIPLKGTINLHASLLPQLRGAAPIHWAIINGLKETGVTTFFINKKIDFGDIIQQSKVKIGDIENTGELYEKLKKDGSKLLISTLKIINNDNFKSTRQTNSGKLLLAPKLNKINTRINWNDSGKDIFNFVRGLSPYPSAWSKEKRSGKILKLHSVKFEKSKTNKINQAGTIQIDKNTIKIITKDGYLEVLELQIEGKKRMSNLEFINGYKNFNSKHLL